MRLVGAVDPLTLHEFELVEDAGIERPEQQPPRRTVVGRALRQIPTVRGRAADDPMVGRVHTRARIERIARVHAADVSEMWDGTSVVGPVGLIHEVIARRRIIEDGRVVVVRRFGERGSAAPTADELGSAQLGIEVELGRSFSDTVTKFRHVLLELSEHHVGPVHPHRLVAGPVLDLAVSVLVAECETTERNRFPLLRRRVVGALTWRGRLADAIDPGLTEVVVESEVFLRRGVGGAELATPLLDEHTQTIVSAEPCGDVMSTALEGSPGRLLQHDPDMEIIGVVVRLPLAGIAPAVVAEHRCATSHSLLEFRRERHEQVVLGPQRPEAGPREAHAQPRGRSRRRLGCHLVDEHAERSPRHDCVTHGCEQVHFLADDRGVEDTTLDLLEWNQRGQIRQRTPRSG